MATHVGETTVELSVKVRDLSKEIAIQTGESFGATWRRVVAVLDIDETERERLRVALRDFAESV